MGLRTPNPSFEQTRSAREIISELLPEIGRINDEAARIEAAANRRHLSETGRRDLLARAVAAQTSLHRIELQLEGALAGQPSEIANHGRVQDVRAAIGTARARLERLGA